MKNIAMLNDLFPYSYTVHFAGEQPDEYSDRPCEYQPGYMIGSAACQACMYCLQYQFSASQDSIEIMCRKKLNQTHDSDFSQEDVDFLEIKSFELKDTNYRMNYARRVGNTNYIVSRRFGHYHLIIEEWNSDRDVAQITSFFSKEGQSLKSFINSHEDK